MSSKTRRGRQGSDRKSQLKDRRITARDRDREAKEFDRQQTRLDKQRASRLAKYERELERLQETGIYNPKSQSITPYKIRRINRAMREFGEFLDPSQFFFIPVEKGDRREILDRASKLKMATSPRGIFHEKDGFARASLQKSYQGPKGEFAIHRTGKVKTGPNAGLKKEDWVPLASIDELTKEPERLNREAEKLGPLDKGDRLAFKIVDDTGEGLSRQTFANRRLLNDKLMQYKRSNAAKIFMYRHVIIEKTTAFEWQQKRRGDKAARETKKRQARETKKRNRKLMKEKGQ